jgi:SAM-dependent methyltransferase
MSGPQRIFDPELLTRRRRRVMPAAPGVDFLMQRAAEDLVDRLAGVQREFKIAADIGAGGTVLARRLADLGSRAPDVLLSVDPLADVLPASEPRPPDHPRILPVAAGEEALPLRESGLDLATSVLSLHLVNDLPGTLVQIRRALKPDGLLLATLLGGETLKELREAMLVAESEVSGGASPRVAPFADVRDLGMLLQRAGFALPVVDADVVSVAYPDPLALMRELKVMGASNMLVERRRVPMSRGLLMRAAAVYAERFSRADGRVLATFEILTLTAWAPHDSQQKPLQPGSAKASPADALGVAKRPAGDEAGTGKSAS